MTPGIPTATSQPRQTRVSSGRQPDGLALAILEREQDPRRLDGQGIEELAERRAVVLLRRLMGKDRAESSSDWPVEGLLAHVTGQRDNGFRAVDVWITGDAR